MLNFLTLLGWSLDDKTEILSRADLIRLFTIERVNKSASVFNQDKLLWTNGYYLRDMPAEALADALLKYWRAYPPDEIPELPEREHLVRIVPLIGERIKTLADAAPLIQFFFRETLDYETDELVQKGMDRAGAAGGAGEGAGGASGRHGALRRGDDGGRRCGRWLRSLASRRASSSAR